eukprot:TRINITY_DN8543_c0_g1_i1.p1 TRINITY_DN8543_c0_g1~~TRINITY_DN8543_c0_g1_i1.p1  ORF type:complete len:479 (-),score=127.52 TRINITY_DN8543_c0_g1_i1:183-1619(-)
MEHDDNDDNVEGKITTTTTWDSDLEDFTIIEKDETDEVFFFIPDEMLIRVFAFLQGKELCEVISLVCRHWKAIAEDDYLWFVMVKKELIKEYVEKEQKKRGIEIEDIKQKEKIEQEEKETADNITENIKEFLAIPLNLFCPIPGTSTSGDTENNNNEETENLIEKKDLDEDNKNNLQSISEHKNIEDEDAPEQVVKIEIDYDLIEKKLRFIKPKSRTWKWVYKSKTNLFAENPNKTKVTGVGKYIWDTNASYEGEWKDGAPNGMGMKYWEEQEYYVGSWISGKMNGYGFYSWEDGASYSGYWRDGFHEGEGIYIWADGNKYEGGWKRSTRNGWGVRTWIDGDIFSGEWVDGKRTGKGTYAWPNGSKYVGDWVSGSHEGQGSYSWLDGRKYSGGWVNSKKEGWGMYYWGDGCVFEGEWKMDKEMDLVKWFGNLVLVGKVLGLAIDVWKVLVGMIREMKLKLKMAKDMIIILLNLKSFGN